MSTAQDSEIERTDEEEIWEAKSISELSREQIETECRRFNLNPKGARKHLESRICDVYKSKNRYFTKECRKRRLEVSGTPFEKRRRLNRYGCFGLSALSDNVIADMLRRRDLKLDSKMKRWNMINSILVYESEMLYKRYNIPFIIKLGNPGADEIPPVLDEGPLSPGSLLGPALTEGPEVFPSQKSAEKTPKTLLETVEWNLAKRPNLDILGLPFRQYMVKNDENCFWRACAKAMTPEEDWQNVKANTKKIWDLALRRTSPSNRVKEIRGRWYKSIRKEMNNKPPGNKERSLDLQFADDWVQTSHEMFLVVLDAYGIEIFYYFPSFPNPPWGGTTGLRWYYRALGPEQTEARNQIHLVWYQALDQWTVLQRHQRPRPEAVKVTLEHEKYIVERNQGHNHVRFGYREPTPGPLPRIKGAKRGQDYVVDC